MLHDFEYYLGWEVHEFGEVPLHGVRGRVDRLFADFCNVCL